MIYYGINDAEVEAYLKTIEIPPFVIIQKEKKDVIEYYANTSEYSFLITRALNTVSIIEEDILQQAQEKFIQIKLDEHFLPLSKELHESVTKAEFRELLNIQTDKIIDQYTLSLIENDLLK
jgi:hypothetical protein